MHRKVLYIIFVGSQGTGKSYHATKIYNKLINNLSLLYKKVMLASLNFHAFLHVNLTRIIDNIICKALNACLNKRFYMDKPSITIGNPKLYYVFLPLFIILHTLAFLLTEAYIHILSKRNIVIIDQEGYIMKQIADLHYLVLYAQLSSKSICWKGLKKLYTFMILRLLRKQPMVIFYLYSDYSTLVRRYIERESPIEPPFYIAIQNTIFAIFLTILFSMKDKALFIYKINTNRPKKNVEEEIMMILSHIIKSEAYIQISHIT